MRFAVSFQVKLSRVPVFTQESILNIKRPIKLNLQATKNVTYTDASWWMENVMTSSTTIMKYLTH